jgi:hypothetical protein
MRGMSEKRESFPVNRENMDALAAWVDSAREQAQRALEVNGPRIAAAFRTMQQSMQGKH